MNLLFIRPIVIPSVGDDGNMRLIADEILGGTPASNNFDRIASKTFVIYNVFERD